MNEVTFRSAASYQAQLLMVPTQITQNNRIILQLPPQTTRFVYRHTEKSEKFEGPPARLAKRERIARVKAEHFTSKLKVYAITYMAMKGWKRPTPSNAAVE